MRAIKKVGSAWLYRQPDGIWQFLAPAESAGVDEMEEIEMRSLAAKLYGCEPDRIAVRYRE